MREWEFEVGGAAVGGVTEGSGPDVVLLHGLGASTYTWRRVWRSLAASFRVHALDFPGFGRSSKPLDFDYSARGFSRVLLGVLDRLDVARASMVGNSMGGVVALTAALESPERVDRLALLGTPTYPSSRPRDLWPLRWPVVGRACEAALGPWAVEWAAKRVFMDRSVITPELLETYGSPLRTPGGRRAVASFIRNAVPPDAQAMMGRYGALPQPTLVLWGDRDCMVRRADAERFAAEIPWGRLVRFAGCGHAPQEERPAAVLDVLHPFLAAHLAVPARG